MKGRKHTIEQIISKLREAEVALAKGQPVGKVARELGITEQTHYRWRKEYGGIRTDQAKRLKELEKENGRRQRSPRCPPPPLTQPLRLCPRPAPGALPPDPGFFPFYEAGPVNGRGCAAPNHG
jgi:hypothetical protein